MKSFKLAFALLLLCGTAYSQDITVKNLSTDQRTNPKGIESLQPGLSWKIYSSAYDVAQAFYSVRVSTDDKFSSSAIVWETGKKAGSQSVLVPYEGKTLKSGTRYFWQVMVWDNKGNKSKWSETAVFETGLLSKQDWKASWIELKGDTNRFSPAPHFRKDFNVSKQVLRATAYVTSHGFYEFHLNGKKVGDQVLTPGWTSYGKRLQYQVFDVTGQLTQGKNAAAAVLGDGWFRGTLAWSNNWAIYGKRLGLLLQINIEYKDGTSELVVTDGTWKGFQDGALRMSDIYDGEIYDATKKVAGWDMPGFDDSKWQKVITEDFPFVLIASEGSPVRKIQEIKPVKIFRTPKGSLVADMGQNMVGWVRLKVTGPKGTVVTVRHAEVLDKYGEFYTTNLRAAKAQYIYTLSGAGDETYEPRFTFMGFRFVEITGFPGTLTADNITGVVVHSDMTPTGTFECSNPLVNQLQHNIIWGQNGNFVDVPTDCPQRNERLGWTGDAQAFCRTAAFNYNVAPFFTKWMKDITADQKPGGEVPDVIPDVLNPQNATTAAPSAGWGDVAVITPWTMYLVYGDKNMLARQYPGMKKWVEYIRKKAGNSYLWKGGSKYGDWLFYHPPVNNHTEADGYTEPDFIATAYYAYSTSLLAKAAKELGNAEDEKTYNDLFNKIREVFIREYVTPAGRVGTCSQTSYILALKFGLLPEDLRPKASAFLASDIKSRGNRLSTGFLGTIYICHELTETGYTDVAYDLLLQERYPSWLYPVKMGATTIWERWDGQKTDSTFQDAGMNSFNHYAYGAIGDWMYRVSAGIEQAAPGYKKMIIQPHPTKKLNYAKATFESVYGTIASGWERKNGKVIIMITVPVNTTATILIPADNVNNMILNGKQVPMDTRIEKGIEGNRVVFEKGSGNYVIEYPEKN